MSDLIDRQAAIDALWGIQRALQMIDASECADITIHGVQLALRKIEQLPSAQAKRPEGEWEPLGHRMGFLKHPDSEDYKCSICGYESYTIFTLPPKTCPECGADMRESVKKLFQGE